MKIKKFIYSTFLPRFVLNMSIGKEIKTNTLSNVYNPSEITDNLALNNYIKNLWHNKDYVKLASVFKEDSSLFSEQQQESLFLQLTQKLYANFEHDFVFSEKNTIILESNNESDIDIYLKPAGLLLILKSNPDFLDNYKKYLQKHHYKFTYSLPMYISMNHFYYETSHSFFSNYLEQSHKLDSISTLVNLSDLNSKTQNILSVIVLSLRKITSNDFLDNNLQLNLGDKNESLDGSDLLSISHSFLNFFDQKNETNIEYHNRLELASIPPTSLISILYNNIVEHNLVNPNKIIPVPIIFAAAYYISKKMDNVNFELSEQDYNICLKANDAYTIMYREDGIMTNQEYLHKFFKQNLYCFNKQNNDFKNLSHSDYLQIIKSGKNEKVNDENYQISNLIDNITSKNSEIDLSSLNQSLQMLSKIDEYNNGLQDKEISKFIDNTRKTIVSILDNYIICNNNISLGISNKSLLEEPVKLIHDSIHKIYSNINEQNLSSFINHSKKHKKIQ